MFLVKFIKFIVFIVIGDDCVIYNSRLLFIVIIQGFSFICCGTVEACKLY